MAGAFLSSRYPLLSAITSYCQLPKWKVEPMIGGTIPVNLVQLATSTGFRSEVSPGYLALVDTALPSTLSQHTYCNTQDLRFVSSAFRASSPCLIWAPSSDLTRSVSTNDPALPDSPDRSDLAAGALGWGGTKLSVRGLPFR